MGVIAFVRQAFLDAQHYALLKQKPDDPTLEAMQPAIDRRMPVAFEANQTREILRVLKMAKELKVEPIVTGGRGAIGVAGDLKSQNVRVIYSVNYPQRPKALAPDADEPLEALRDRADAPKAPGELAKSGVTFAFESAGLADPKDFVKNVGRAIKAGLAEDAAVRAMTIDAARIAGVSDRVGSIEKGKAANLIVTDGNLFEERTKITRVFVGGRAVALESAPAPAGRGRGRGGN
jgi:imidazolonepropionase-like amidohydrolase